MRRFLSGLALIAVSSVGQAQHTSLSATRLGFGLHVAIGRASARAPLCDGSEMASVRSRRSLGKGLIIGGVALGLLTPTISNDYAKELDLLTVALVASAGGLYLHNTNPSDQFWQSTMSQIKVGRTQVDDVRQCLGGPSTTTSSGTDETWTYQTAHSGFLGLGGSARSASITFRNGVVSNFRKTDYGY